MDISEGKVPTDLNGVYLRNGPNFAHMPKTERVHWFDGDGMIHAFRLKEGKIFYCNRYTMTPHLQQEFAADRAQGIRLGEMVGLAGLFKVLMYEL